MFAKDMPEALSCEEKIVYLLICINKLHSLLLSSTGGILVTVGGA